MWVFGKLDTPHFNPRKYVNMLTMNNYFPKLLNIGIALSEPEEVQSCEDRQEVTAGVVTLVLRTYNGW